MSGGDEQALVEDGDSAKAFAEAPRTAEDRVVLRVGDERLELNRWGTALVSALVGGSPMTPKAVKVLRPRRMKRPRENSARTVEASTPVSTARVAAPLGVEALGGTSGTLKATSKPDRASRRAARKVRRYASGDIRVAADDEAARRFLAHALATSDPVVATYRDREVTFTDLGSRAVLGLLASHSLRLAFVHLLLGADRYRPNQDGAAEPLDPADPWGPFIGGSFTIG
jgi:hypothetical protein